MAKMKLGFSSRPVKGEKYNGDKHIFIEFDHKILIVLIDGLGHGERAAIASEKCVRCIEEVYKEDIALIIEDCDRSLKKTNGAVMGVISIDLLIPMLIYAGVGNISASVIGKKSVSFISRDGIVGYRLPKIKKFMYPYSVGDTIIMYSDGISSKAAEYPLINIKQYDVQELADEIMRLYGKDEDDATVIVAR